MSELVFIEPTTPFDKLSAKIAQVREGTAER
jgi:hypothetical protein